LPQQLALGPGETGGVQRVAIAVRAREDDHADPHGRPSGASASIVQASMIGFEKTSPASRSTVARAASGSGASTVSSTRPPARTPDRAATGRGGRGWPAGGPV